MANSTSQSLLEKHPRLRIFLRFLAVWMLFGTFLDYGKIRLFSHLFSALKIWVDALLAAIVFGLLYLALRHLLSKTSEKFPRVSKIPEKVESVLETRPAFVMLFAICVLSVWTRPLDERLYWGVVYFMAVGLPGLLKKHSSDWGNTWTKLLFDGFFATLFALLFVVAQNDFPDLAAFAKGVGKGATVAIIVMAVDRVGQSANSVTEMKEAASAVLKESEEATKELTKHAESLQRTSNEVAAMIARAEEAIHAARYAGVAARVLRLREDALLDEGRSDPGMLAATESAHEAIRSWVLAGQSVRDKDSRSKDALKSAGAWWKIMGIYHHEEAYDVSQFEFATNVRNFAFILIGTIGRYLKQLEANNERQVNKRKLVVANVTPFAPKDLFNYPNGSRKNRHYHEPEFYGTYRRVMSSVATHPSVYTLRVSLAAADEILTMAHDWPLDSVEKLALDCARLHLLPVPVRVLRPSTNDRVPADSPAAIGIRRPAFSPEKANHDPFVRLPPNTTHYYWNRSRVSLEGAFDPNASKEKNDWLARAMDFQGPNNVLGESPHAVGKDFTAWVSRYDRDRQEAWDLLLRRSPGWTRLSEDEEGHLETIKAYIHAWPGGSAPESKDQRRPENLKQAVTSLAKKLPNADAPDVEVYVDKLRALYACQGKLDSIAESGRVDRSADLILELVELSHDIDSRAKIIEQRPAREQAIVSSSGLQLGYAENWLYATLIWFQAARYRDLITREGMLPTWKALAVEICGIDLAASGSDGSEESLIDSLLKRFEVCTVGENNASTQAGVLAVTSFEEMQKHAISQEFLLIGEVSDGAGQALGAGDVSQVKWHALITADVQEPFHTCRLKVRFSGDDDLRLHAGWFTKIWRDRSANQKFKELLRREINAQSKPGVS